VKALSIKQPWLWAITHLDKRIENRTWKPPEAIIGRQIALHASKADDRAGYAAIREISGVEAPPDLPRGAIIATARVVGFYDEISGFSGDPVAVKDKWFFGPYGWVLSDIRPLPKPISCPGALGLWEIPPGLLVDLKPAGNE